MLTLLLSLFACAPAPTAAGDCPAGPGQVWDLDREVMRDSLDSALNVPGETVHLCLGDGKFPVDGPLLALDSDQVDPPDIHITGQGAYRTLLVPGRVDGLRAVVHGELRLEGVSITGPVDLIGGQVDLRDVAIHGVQDPDLVGLVDISGGDVTVDGLTLTDNLIAADLLRIWGRSDSAVIDVYDLAVYDNRALWDFEIILGQGRVNLEHAWLSNNHVQRVDSPHHFVTLAGPTVAYDVHIQGNNTNGPALSAFARLDAESLLVSENEGSWATSVYLGAPATLTKTLITGNRAPNGAVGLYPSQSDRGSVWLQAVDLGAEEQGCDISAQGVCLRDDLTLVGDLVCEAGGCR
ncbi:MAG: hypothetical protein H6739_21310 [Alphaproteobacteria bacterium]|nr:hypothetical protein [Alphaproteobacteria bacterium]